MAGTTWENLKPFAMLSNYQEHQWFADLSETEKELVKLLRANQENISQQIRQKTIGQYTLK